MNLIAQAWSLDFLNNTANAAVVLGCVAGIVAMVLLFPLITWLKRTRIREDAALKARMIERGMSVDEIERVLKAKSEE